MAQGTGKTIDAPSTLGIGRFLWLKILFGGLLVFILLERVLVATGTINYVPPLLIVGACTVPFSVLAFLYGRGRNPSVSMGSLLICGVWGGAVGAVSAAVIEYHTLVRLDTLPMLLVSFIGELVKLIVPTLFIFGGKNYSELGCIVIGAVTGAGFAVLEAMGYGLGALLFTGGGITDANHVLLVRVLVAPAVHIAWTALAADALWHLRGGTNHAVLRCVTTVLGVVLLHALWNNTTPLAWLMSGIVGVASLGWLAVRVRRAVHGSQSGLTSLVAALTLM